MCWETIKEFIFREKDSEIKDLESLITELQDNQFSNVAKITDLERQIRVLTKEKQHFQDELLFLKASSNERPDLDVDWSKPAYTGTNANLFYDLADQKIKTNYAKITISKYYRFWNDEFYQAVTSAYRRDRPEGIRNQLLWAKNMVHNDWRMTYQHDYDSEGRFTENWKTIPQIWADRKLDCEDFVILILGIMNVIGASGKDVFNLTGYYGNEGHSFLGFIEDDKVYVLEATSKFSLPILMKGSNYKCKGSLSGISGFHYSGVPNVEQF